MNIHIYKQFTGICRQCWRQVWKFCNFQKSIHEAQIKLVAEKTEKIVLNDVVNDTAFDDLINVEDRTAKFVADHVQQHQEEANDSRTSHVNPEKTLHGLIEPDLITILPPMGSDKTDSRDMYVVEDVSHDHSKREKSLQDNQIFEVLPNSVVVKEEVELYDVASDYHESEDEDMPSVSSALVKDPVASADSYILKEEQLHDKGKTRKPAQCQLCGIYARTTAALKIHVELKHFVDSDTNSVECRVCLRPLKSKRRLFVHYQQHHRLQFYKFCCEFCSRLFSKSSVYIDHLRKQHSDERTETKLVNSLIMKNAEKSCDVGKPHCTGLDFECEFCTKSFCVLKELKEHQLNNHPSKMKKLNNI